MQISTKGRYALRFLLDLSQHQDQGPVALKSIAERQGISKKYLEHVISMLNPTGMLNITRGYQGGYRLAKSPSDITVADVLRATEGGLAPVPYKDGHVSDVTQEETMSMRVWEGLEGVMARYLEGMTLQDMLDSGSAEPAL